MKFAPIGAAGEALPIKKSASPPHVDPAYALIRAVPPSAAALVHNEIMAMLARTAPRPSC